MPDNPIPDGQEPRRPRDLALLLLAMGGGSPRQRARDQQADLAGAEIRRRVLDRISAIDPEPGDLDLTLNRIVLELGEPTGPTRGVALGIRQEWQECRASPIAWGWMIGEAIKAADGSTRRRKGRGPQDAA